MAVYKVIQDIEAEDKLLGPLTLKGFIYAITAGFLAFVNVRIAIGGTGGSYRFIAIFILFWPMLLFGVLASPLGREQPTEVWLLSHIRFLIKPKLRLWNQLGLSELVTITVPKKADLHLTKNLTQPEVNSRLETLAMTMDSRGWAIKNVAEDTSALNTPLGYLTGTQDTSDRLVQPDLPPDNPITDVHASEDVLDLQNNLKAQQMDSLMQRKATELREERLAKIDAMRRGVIINPQNTPTRPRSRPTISTRHDTLYTEAQLKGIKVQPKEQAALASSTAQKQGPRVSATNLNLSQNADDISVAAVSEMANHTNENHITQIAPGEVEIDLH